MKRLGLLFVLVACGCGGSSSGIADFRGTWVGTITETYTCTQSMPPAFQIPSEAFDIGQSGPSVSIAIASCNGLVLDGNAAGDTVNITPSTTGQLCQQQDAAGDTISVDEFTGGTLTLTTGTTLDVVLNEQATINGDACTGQATGTLVLQ